MKYLKRFLLFLLHTGATLCVQYCLYGILIHEGGYLKNLLCAVAVCILDLILSCFLLKGNDMRRILNLVLQFWDLLLLSPLFLIALFSFFSDGAGFGTAALLIDLFLIAERSTSFVLFDPARRR